MSTRMPAESQDSLWVVDDDPRDRNLIITALREAGFPGQIIEPGDGVDTMRHLTAVVEGGVPGRGVGNGAMDGASGSMPVTLPRLLVLDHKMRGLTGLEVLAAIKHHDALRHLPIVILSSSEIPSDHATAIALGAEAYLIKPTNLASLRVCAQAILRIWHQQSGHSAECPATD
jgi:CheY-like chemotaxis protein